MDKKDIIKSAQKCQSYKCYQCFHDHECTHFCKINSKETSALIVFLVEELKKKGVVIE